MVLSLDSPCRSVGGGLARYQYKQLTYVVIDVLAMVYVTVYVKQFQMLTAIHLVTTSLSRYFGDNLLGGSLLPVGLYRLYSSLLGMRRAGGGLPPHRHNRILW